MKYSNIKLVILLYITLVFLFSCKDDDNPKWDGQGNLVLEFDHVVGNQDLVLNTGTYKNANNEDFQVRMLQYYISNIKLKTEEGKEYALPQDSSYFLIKEGDEAFQSALLKNIPAGNYSEVTFTIGVDSLRCTMSADKRTGVLDVGNENTGKGMYWAWNSGYIHFRIEGASPQSSHEYNGEKLFFYHVGGFGGYSTPTVNNIRTTSLKLSQGNVEIRKNKTASLHIKADVLKVFNGETNISFATNPFSHFTAWSSSIANNYKNIFSVDHIHNE